MVLTTWPWCSTIAARSSASWRASAVRMAWGASSHSAVLASTSVRRNVTVPLSSSAMPSTPVPNGAASGSHASARSVAASPSAVNGRAAPVAGAMATNTVERLDRQSVGPVGPSSRWGQRSNVRKFVRRAWGKRWNRARREGNLFISLSLTLTFPLPGHVLGSLPCARCCCTNFRTYELFPTRPAASRLRLPSYLARLRLYGVRSGRYDEDVEELKRGTTSHGRPRE